MNDEQVKQMVDTIQNEGRNLTEWEDNFVKSCITQYKRKGSLSERQVEIIERIYAQKTPTGSAYGEPADGAIQKFKRRYEGHE
jgi:hypothetical protein